MNEFTVRAKRTDTLYGENNNWIAGFLSIMWGSSHIVEPDDENTAYPVDETTVCRNVGVLDKNERLIWENDIVEAPDGTRYLVKYYKPFACFMLTSIKTGGGTTGVQLPLHTCKVVGNSFDDPLPPINQRIM